jgi:hypothetical protein
LIFHIYSRCLSVSEQEEQKSSDMREKAIKWGGKQKVIDDLTCCEFQINYMDEVMCMLLFTLVILF